MGMQISLKRNHVKGKHGFAKKEQTASKGMRVRFVEKDYKLIHDFCKSEGITLSEFMRSAANEYLRSHMGQSEKLQREKETEMA